MFARVLLANLHAKQMCKEKVIVMLKSAVSITY